MIKFTRKDYMDNKCSHREYYGQFVDAAVRNTVSKYIGRDTILKCRDNENFSDISLVEWDRLELAIRYAVGSLIAKANGTGGISLSDCVCVAKEAARQIYERTTHLEEAS